MSEAIAISIQINGKDYKIACDKNEVGELKTAAKNLNTRIDKIVNNINTKLNNELLLLFASLELENLILDMQKDSKPISPSNSNKEKLIDSLTITIENFIKKVENMD